MTDTNISIITDTKEKIIAKLTPSGWADKLRMFLKGEEMNILLEKLLTESQEGRHFTPTLKDVFAAFEKCPFDKTKVVLMGQDPYPYLGVADGLAFSCSKTGKIQPSLRYIFKALENQTGVEQTNPDLTRWAEQGVLMLNTALTCQIDKVGSHYDIWKDFLFMVIDALNYHSEGTIYVLMGKQAHSFGSYITPTSPIIKISHPASAAYAKANEWDCDDCFNKVNQTLMIQRRQPINW
jgi:uracil-DNA glycosylase